MMDDELAQPLKIEQTLIALERIDGGVSLMAFLIVARGNQLPVGAVWLDERSGWWGRNASDENIAREISCIPEAADVKAWHRVSDPADQVPTDRTYRDAWSWTGSKVEHDMTRAREVHRDRIRKARGAAFAALDGKFTRALGQKDQAAADAIEAKRQAWRDAPADLRIDNAIDVDQLKAIGTPPID